MVYFGVDKGASPGGKRPPTKPMPARNEQLQTAAYDAEGRRSMLQTAVYDAKGPFMMKWFERLF